MVVLFSWLSDFIVKLTTTTQPDRGERERVIKLDNSFWFILVVLLVLSFSPCSLGSTFHPGGSHGPILLSFFSRYNLSSWWFSWSYPSLLVLYVQPFILVVLLVLSFSPCSLGSIFHPGGSPGPFLLSLFFRFNLASWLFSWSYPFLLVNLASWWFSCSYPSLLVL